MGYSQTNAGLRREVQALTKRLEAATLLLGALDYLQWVPKGDGSRYCWWCNSYEDEGHIDECLRQQALAAWRAADGG